ncbi:hypothetical protein GHT06_019016 [Daphnia sinensis]|uniref:Retrotransposon gag domain-containing protein n=1 Tax=Daphnia sinensis TaxID=1820382 RepID=A0AAD5L9U8_9CRUS|nr:hypothetical protein GHT06_019016 [Daphnia sinensis]
MPRQRRPCNHCVEGQPSICNFCGKANYQPIPRNYPITTRAAAQRQREDYTEDKLNNMANLNEMQQAIAALTAVVQAQQQTQQQQGNALQIALQAIQNNQNTVISQPLPTFSGRVEEDVYEWLETVQRESTAGGWNEDRKRRMANAALRGVAANWQWQPLAGVADDWAGWSAAFRETFRKRYTFVEWENMVKTRHQLVGESATQYALSKSTLRRYCPHQMNEEEFVPYLINGIRHHQFAPVLVHSQLTTVQAFIQTYSRLEAAINHTPDIPDKHEKTIETLIAQNATLTAQITDLQRRMASQHSTPTYQPPQRQPTNQSTLGKQISRTDGAGPALGSVEDLECANRPAIIEVTIDGIVGKLNALVDPGATVNAISQSLVSHLRIGRTQSPPLRFAHGTTSKAPIGEIVLNVSWEGQKEQVKLLVLGGPSHPIILGTNWIARVGVNVSLSEKGVMEARAGGLKLSDLKKDTSETESNDWLAACMMPEKEVEQAPRSLTVQKTTILPAQSLVFVQVGPSETGKGTNENSDQEFIINRTYSARPGKEWVIPSSLITHNEAGLFVPVLNPTLNTIRFNSGEEIMQVEVTTELEKPKSPEVDDIQSNQKDMLLEMDKPFITIIFLLRLGNMNMNITETGIIRVNKIRILSWFKRLAK